MLSDNQVRISDSPTGKARVVEWIGINTRWDLQTITILTRRKFFDKDQNNNLTTELTGIDYPVYETNITANNEKLCNPENGLRAYLYTTGNTSGNTYNYYLDYSGNTVSNPVGMFDYFRPFLSLPVAQNDLIKQNILRQDSVYGTWN